MKDEQREYDEQEAGEQLDALVRAIEEDRTALEKVRMLEMQLRNAKAAYKSAQRRLGELAFLARKRRERVTGGDQRGG